MAQKATHIPKFGNWDPNDHISYTACFNQAQDGKGGKMLYSIDASESNVKLSESKININGVSTKVTTQHRRRGSRDDTEFGLGGQGGNGRHVRRTSRGEELSVSHIETRNSDHAHVGRRGSAPGTPSRNQTERYAAQLPKFGDWDVNNPGAGDGFTMIFDKARDEKKTGGPFHAPDSPFRHKLVETQNSQPTQHESSKWFCSCFQPNTL